MKLTTKVIVVGNTPLAFFLAQILSTKENLIVSVLKTEENRIIFDDLPVTTTGDYSEIFSSDIVILALKPERKEIEAFFHKLKSYEDEKYLDKKTPVKRYSQTLLSLVPGLQMEDIKSNSLFSKNVVAGFIDANITLGSLNGFISADNDEAATIVAAIFHSVKKVKNKHIWRDAVINNFGVYLGLQFLKTQTPQTLVKLRDYYNVTTTGSSLSLKDSLDFFKNHALLQSFFRAIYEFNLHKVRDTGYVVPIINTISSIWMLEKQTDTISLLENHYGFPNKEFKNPYDLEDRMARLLASRPRLQEFIFTDKMSKRTTKSEQLATSGRSFCNTYSFVKVSGLSE